MNPIPPHRTEDHSEETSLLAYHLWQQEHCPPGQDLHFWLKAERQLFGNRDQQPAANAKAATKRATAPAGNGSIKKGQSANGRKSVRA